jgi:hypothetical protein
VSFFHSHRFHKGGACILIGGVLCRLMNAATEKAKREGEKNLRAKDLRKATLVCYSELEGDSDTDLGLEHFETIQRLKVSVGHDRYKRSMFIKRQHRLRRDYAYNSCD